MFRASHLMIRPSFEEVRALSAKGNLIPIFAELPTDLDTPVTLFLKLAGNEPSFLLESVTGGEQVARYSFLGVRIREALVLKGRTLSRHTLVNGNLQIEPLPPANAPDGREPDVLDSLRAEMGRYHLVPRPELPRFCGGLVGFTGYDVVRQFERLPSTARDVLDLPDAIYMLADTFVVFDHARHHVFIIANAHVKDDSEQTVEAAYEDAVARIKTLYGRLNTALLPLPQDFQAVCSPTRANKTQAEYEQMVQSAKEHIKVGDIFQVVLSRRLERHSNAHPFAIYRALRMLNPSPWMFYLHFANLIPIERGSLRVIGASPEMHARFENGIATVRPIAGTRPRGANEIEDQALSKDLLDDPKERAEHVMLVDLGRNDIGRVAEYGSVNVSSFMEIENYSHVMHIVSTVQGRVRQGLDMFDVLRATFPAGTLSGAPKVRAMEIIEQLEGERRGIYGGCVGYFSFSGQMDTCIIIRTIVMRGDMCYLQAGAGIVADSNPTNEYHETLNKTRALVLAIDAAEE